MTFISVNTVTGPVVRVGPDEVDVTDLATVKIIHRVKADFVKTDFYKGIGYAKENIIGTQVSTPEALMSFFEASRKNKLSELEIYTLVTPPSSYDL